MGYQIADQNRKKPMREVAPDGEYIVTVEGYEKGLTKKQSHVIYNLTLSIEGHPARVEDGIVLCESMDWKTEAFLKATGRLGGGVNLDVSKDEDDRILKGARGWARIGTEKWTDKRDGKTEHKKNIVIDWLPGKAVPAVSPEEF
jgi:hypothetical protein